MIRVAAAGGTPELVDDDLDTAAAVELDRRAVRRATDGYLGHVDRLYDDPVGADDWDGWLCHPLTTRNDRYWPAFRGYVVLTKLRFRLRDGAGPVAVGAGVSPALAAAVAAVCVEFDVDCRRGAEPAEPDDASDDELLWGVPGRVYALGRLWVAFLLFVLLGPLVRRAAGEPEGVDVRFWLHPLHPDRGRFHDAPATLAEDRTVGYAVHDRVPTGGPVEVLRSALRAVRTDGDDPVRAAWYATGAVGAAATALRLRWRFRRRGRRLSARANSPEFGYLAAHVGSVTRTELLVPLLAERAFDAVARTADDGVWVRSQHVTASLPRLTAVVGDRHDLPVVAVLSHYCSRTRPSNRFSHRELAGPQAVGFPDRLVVSDALSAANCHEDGVARDTVPVTADKAVAEFGPAYAGTAPDLPSPDVEPPDGDLTVLVPLQTPDENRRLVDAARAAAARVDGVELVFKPHPFFDADDLFGPADAGRVASPDADLGALAAGADVCLSIYSTATFPALVRGVPVVWLPFVGENHAFMDLVDRVGERADDEAELAAALERLAGDPGHYRQRAAADRRFATANLLPDTDRRLADVVRGLLGDAGAGDAPGRGGVATDRHD